MRGLSAQPQGQIVFAQADVFQFANSYYLSSNTRGQFALEAARIGHSRAHFGRFDRSLALNFGTN